MLQTISDAQRAMSVIGDTRASADAMSRQIDRVITDVRSDSTDNESSTALKPVLRVELKQFHAQLRLGF